MNILSSIRKHSVITTTIAVLAVSVTVIAGREASKKDQTPLPNAGAKSVALVDVSSFLNGTSTVAADGVVEAASQVDLKSQISAPVLVQNVSIGDTVYAGETLVQLQNADLQAQLDQARASLSLAQGQYGSSAVSLDSAERQALDKIRASYQTADEIVNGGVDQFLFTTAGNDQPLSIYIPDFKTLDTLHTERTDVSNQSNAWKNTIDGLSTSSSDAELQSAIAQSKTVFATITKLLDEISSALNLIAKSTPPGSSSTFSGWQSTVTAARASATGAVADLTAAGNALSGALSSHGSPAEAQISIATAGVKSLEAQLAKTYIVSPISGKVAALPLRVGELATPGTLLASVVGDGGIQVTAYVSGKDLSRVVTGARASVNGKVPGTVISVAPSVNQTNKKVEVKIAIADAAKSGLVVGQSVSVSIAGTAVASSQGDAVGYRVPIQDVKIVPGNAYVFTADADSKAVQHAVVLGDVSGDFVTITSGVSPDMQIVSPVYGIEEGQVVSVQ